MKKQTSLIILFLVTVFGFILRYINITSYNIYSDSYEYMLVAKNLVEHYSVDGHLGQTGMYWGPLFYNRIGFGLFLAPFYWLTRNLELSTHILVFTAGILAIPLIYLLAVKIFKKREIGLIAALLLSVSFSSVMLSGFIMANSLIVLFIILSLLFFYQAQEKNRWQWYVLFGIVLALTFFLRVELLITLPAFIILIILKEKFGKSLLVFLLAFLGTIGLSILKVYFFLVNPSVWRQSQYVYFSRNINRYSLVILIFILILGALIYSLKKKKSWFLEKSAQFYGILVILSLLLCFVIPLIAGRAYNWQASWFTLRTDFIVIVFGIIGLILLFKKDFYKALFSYLFIFPLFAVYFSFGGGGDFRHINLILPILTILAAFTIWQILGILKKWLDKKKGLNYKFSLFGILLIIGLLFYLQFYQDWKPWHSLISYEKEVGQSVKKIIDQENISSNAVLISSFPEAHYLYTDLSTWEQKNEKPFLDKSISGDQEIILVIDEGTRDKYPILAEIADKNLKQYALKSILSTVKYQYGSNIWWPKRLTTIYRLKAGELRKEISD